MAEANQFPRLFDEFPAISRDEWMAQVQTDLKGADFNKKLVWKSPDGFEVQPFYLAEDLGGQTMPLVHPGQFPFLRGYRSGGNTWFIRQDIDAGDTRAANRKALDILLRGADSIGFRCSEQTGTSLEEFRHLLEGIHPEAIELNFLLGNASLSQFPMLLEALREKGTMPEEVQGSLDYDPLGTLCTRGALTGKTPEVCFTHAHSLIRDAMVHLPRFRVLAVHGNYFHEAGATPSQELAFALSQAVEYLHRMQVAGLKPGETAPRLTMVFGIGSHYFMEIARLRAARLLWSRILEAWGIEPDTIPPLHIHCVTSTWNLSTFDPYVNMLRATTEAMSAIIGGASSLAVQPFNAVFDTPNEFSERIARNIQLILKDEAGLDKVADPAGGSYYIEKLTTLVAESAWKLFLDTESEGGFLEALRTGFIQNKLKENAAKRRQDVAFRREILLGTNQYANPQERMTPAIKKVESPDLQLPAEDQLVQPIHRFRGADAFEKLRLAVEKNTQDNPVVFLLPFGNVTMRKARAGFASNFFGCAGIKAIDSPGFRSPEEGARAALKSGAPFVVLCSSDEEYTDLVPAVLPMLQGRTIPVLAGYPTDQIESYRSQGLVHFIHVRSNVQETLQTLLEDAGILPSHSA